MTKRGANRSEPIEVEMAISPCKGKDHDLTTKTTSFGKARRIWVLKKKKNL